MTAAAKIAAGCSHRRAQWELQLREPFSAEARLLRCNECWEVVPMGSSYDPPPVPWECIAIDVSLAILDGDHLGAIDLDLAEDGITASERAFFWHGLREAACGEACVTLASISEALAKLAKSPDDEEGRKQIQEGREKVMYAAGALAFAYLGDAERRFTFKSDEAFRCDGCATGTVRVQEEGGQVRISGIGYHVEMPA